MLTRALADEYARRLDRHERRIDELRRDLEDVARELKRRPDKAEEAELVDALHRSLDAEDAEIEQARRELAAARADCRHLISDRARTRTPPCWTTSPSMPV